MVGDACMNTTYTCQCGSKWKAFEDEDGLIVDAEISMEYIEKEGCPDCMKECERCGELIGSGRLNWIEHCL